MAVLQLIQIHLSPASGADHKLLGQPFAKVIWYHLVYSFQVSRFVSGELSLTCWGKSWAQHLWHLQPSHWWMLLVHPDDFDPVTSRIKLLAQVTWMQALPVCTTYDGEYTYVRMYPMHLYFGKHIVCYSREVSIQWRYFGFGGSSKIIATLDVLVEQTRFHICTSSGWHLKTAIPCNGGWNDWKKIRCPTGTSHCHSTHLI